MPSNLILVNNDNKIDQSYKVKKMRVQGKYSLDWRAAINAKKMIKATTANGINLIVISAYRDPKYQKKLFDEDVRSNMEKGYTFAKACKITAMSIAKPYCSEHNTGLALDILSDECEELSEDFENTKAYKWLKANAHRFGFILRYPKGSEHITGIIFEPWHYRFVGKKHAKKIKAMGVTLEEYLDYIKQIKE